jgi:hypothetical protein
MNMIQTRRIRDEAIQHIRSLPLRILHTILGDALRCTEPYDAQGTPPASKAVVRARPTILIATTIPIKTCFSPMILDPL